MKQVIIFSIITLSSVYCAAQFSDLLILKKNNRTIQAFFPGNDISFNTASGYYSGIIRSINRDSLFLVYYNIRQMPTNLGVYVLDTIGTYPFAVNYKEITGFGRAKKNKFDWSASGGALLGGGLLLTTVGLGTWLFTKPNTRYYASPYLVGGAAVLGGIGYLLLQSGGKGMVLGKKYTLEYINVK
ncbi:MAG: hypothetical protein ABI416_01380 [Ginsengibacter sp.]